MSELRPGAPIDVLQTWADPPEWWPACVRKTADVADGGSLRALLAGEAFGPSGGISAFAVFVADEGRTWRRRVGSLETLENALRLDAVADELGCDPTAAIFHAREITRERDRWAGIVKKRELALERLRAILDGKIDPVLLENDKLRSEVREALELLSATRELVHTHAQLADDSGPGRALRAVHDLLFPTQKFPTLEVDR